MLQADALVQADVAAPRWSAERRLAWGLFASLLFHALLLSLQFGVPGMAVQGARSAIDVVLAPVLPPTPTPQPEPVVPDSVPTAIAPVPVSGMRLLDPVARPAPATPRPQAVNRDKPRQARRISTPLARPEADAPVRVIAQSDNADSEFVVPLPQPEEALQKTIDPVEAQHGSDDLAEVAQEEAPLPDLQLPALADNEPAQEDFKRAADEERRAAAAVREQAALAQQRLAQEQAARQAQEAQLAQQLAERRKADEIVAQQRRDVELAERQKADELLARRRIAQEQFERERLAREQAERQRLAQEQAERQRLAELAARRLADERARQEAARAREAAVASTAAPAGDPFGATEGQGGSGRTSPPANYGSDLANRVRDLSKGLDLLTGAPPARPRADDARQSRRVVVDNAERDVPLRMYVESWRQKIERNGAMNFPRMIGDRARIDPLVSVAVRSDGSIEDVTIVRSSGRQDTDDAVRRIVRINALYSRFPPNIAARYDVIEIRRIWTFDQVLKLIEEIR